MRIEIKVVPGAKKNLVKDGPQGRLVVYVTAPANDGKANKAVIDSLAKHFDVAKSKITIVRGMTSRVKVLDIESN